MGFATLFVDSVLKTYIAIVELIHLDATGAQIQILTVFVGGDDRCGGRHKTAVQSVAFRIGNMSGLRETAIGDIGETGGEIQTIFVTDFYEVRV